MRKLICNDSFGNRIYPGDVVELFIGIETRTAWKSHVYWNMLDGAFVEAHPAHKAMKLSTHRNLRDFLGKEDIRIPNEDGNIEVLNTYCQKVKR